MDENVKLIELTQAQPFDNCERVIFTGASNTGKTYLMEQLIRRYHDRFYKIVVSGCKNKLFDFPETRFKTELYNGDSTTIFNPLTDIDEYDLKKHKTRQMLVIYDDLMQEVHTSSVISDVFSKGRHKNVSIVLLLQSYFPVGAGRSVYPQIKSNSTLQIFTKLRSQGEIGLIARRLEYTKPSQLFFCNLIKSQVQNQRYGYISVFLDDCESIKYRNNLVYEDLSKHHTVFCLE